MLAHHSGRPDEFIHRRSAPRQDRQQRRNLRGVGASVHDDRKRVICLRPAQRRGGEGRGQQRLKISLWDIDHVRSF